MLMKYNNEKIDSAVLALLFLTSFEEHGVRRAWKGHDWEVLDRLHSKGLIMDPKNKNKSVVLTEEGSKLSEEYFSKLFCD